jgi:hypothetical protein
MLYLGLLPANNEDENVAGFELPMKVEGVFSDREKHFA